MIRVACCLLLFGAMLGCELIGGIEQRTVGAEPSVSSASATTVSTSSTGGVGGAGGEAAGGQPCGNAGGGVVGEPELVYAGSINYGSQLSGHIAVDDARVYWVEGVLTQADVISMAHDGSDLVTLASDQALTHAIEVDATHLYWARWNQWGLYRVDKQAGGAPELLESVGFQPVALALDSTYVYWLTTPLRPDNGEAHLGRVTKTGDGGSAITNSPVNPQDLALSAGSLYWTEFTAKQIWRIQTNGAGETTLYDTVGNPNFIAADGADLYWTEELPDRVMMAAADGGRMAPLSEEAAGPGEIAVDATHVYWVNDDGTLRRAGRDGCEPAITIAQGFTGMHAVALSPTTIFFTSDDGIWRLAK